jgi:quercetin dioxygenase-like cupin family protein
MTQKKQEAVLYDLSKMKEDRMTPMVTRKMIVGKNEMLGYLFAKKGAVALPHRHVSEQITVILKGAEKITVNNQEIVVRPGQILVIPPNLEHSGETLEDTIEMNCFSPLRQDWLSGELGYLSTPTKTGTRRPGASKR